MYMAATACVISGKRAVSYLRGAGHRYVDMRGRHFPNFAGTPHCSTGTCGVYLWLHFCVCMVLVLDARTE